VTQAHKDYSSTPLPKKLGIREGSRVLLISAPPDFPEALRPMPNGVSMLRRGSRDLDVIVVFATAYDGLARRFPALVPSLTVDGRLWVAWPKKASKVATDLTFDRVQSLGLGAGLVDNKGASISTVFQGLQFVVRLKDRRR
jgi:hypothetical protein